MEVFERLRGKLLSQRSLCDRVDSWMRPELQRGFDLPSKAGREHRALADLSRTPWLRLVVDTCIQSMYVDNIVGESGRVDELWRLWNANGMRSRQVSNHRAMLAYGHSYAVVRNAGSGVSVRFVSPRRIAVEYEDFTSAQYPSAALEVISRGVWRLHVPGFEVPVVENEQTPGADRLVTGEPIPTGLDYVPVVRFANQLDLEGKVLGEVEPFIPAAQRINKTAYDRLLAQHFNSWKVKTATGLEVPSAADEYGNTVMSPEEAEREAERLMLRLSQDDILVSDNPDAKFGTLDATALDPFVHAWRADIEALAAVSQTPAHALTGQLVNMSAEALAAARAPLTQKVYERQMNAGDSYSRMLRTMAKLEGRDDIAADPMVRVTWQDMEIRSLSQAADALGKLTQMLGIPARGLWPMVPGVEQTDIAEWTRMLEEDKENAVAAALYSRHALDTLGEANGSDE